MPQFWLTESGPKPEYGPLYGMIEYQSIGYPPRTKANVRDSDGTIIFDTSKGYQSNGTVCTVNACIEFGKPVMVIACYRFKPTISVEEVVRFIIDNNIKVLNVAGNRESKAVGIAEFVKRFMSSIFEKLQNV